MVSFCFFFFVHNSNPVVNKQVWYTRIRRVVENGLATGYVFPGCNPYSWALRLRPLCGDWMHPGSTFTGSIPNSLTGRWLWPSAPLV